MPGTALKLLSRGAAAGKSRTTGLSGSGRPPLSCRPCWPDGQRPRCRPAARGPTVTRALLRPEPSSPSLHRTEGPASATAISTSLDGSAVLALAGLVAAAWVGMLALAEPAAAASLAVPSLDQILGAVKAAVAEAGALGPVIFVAAYVAATVLLIPGSLLTLAAGALFGPLLGTAVVSVASTLGAAAAFLVGRYLARPAVERMLASNPKFAAVDAAIGLSGARIVLLLRLSPLFPFSLLNYLLSLSKVELGQYVWASWAGMLPGTIAYVGLGSAGRAAAESAAGSGMDPVRLVLYVVGAAATLWVTKIISTTATKALKEAEEQAAVAEGQDTGR